MPGTGDVRYHAPVEEAQRMTSLVADQIWDAGDRGCGEPSRRRCADRIDEEGFAPPGGGICGVGGATLVEFLSGGSPCVSD